MDVSVNAQVECMDGSCGHSVGVIVSPRNQQVTHLIVKPREDLKRLVSVDKIAEASPTLIRLRCSQSELTHMDPFIEHEYIMLVPEAFMWTPAPQMIPVPHRRVPKGELAIERGSRVEATDGQVGKVDELLIDPRDEHITHLVLREGHLWEQRDVTIPASEIDHIEDDTVFLKLDKRAVASLPSVPVSK
jgi:sporulation protein YlmC with PRC-barrel domain